MKNYYNLVSVLGNKKVSYANKRAMNSCFLVLMLTFLCVCANLNSNEIPKNYKPTRVAGVFSQLNDIEKSASMTAEFNIAKSEVFEVAATSDQFESDDEYDEWSDVVMANVDEYVYVRSDDNAEAEVVGKLRRGDRATLIDVYDGWYEIESGNCYGYVSADYCVTGLEACELAAEVCVENAVTNVAGLRIRAEASEAAKIIASVPVGTKLIVDKDAPEVDGWVAVQSAGKKGYVKAEYVDVDMNLSEAITVEEEQQAIEEAKKAKEEAELAAQKAKAAAQQAAAQNQSIVASADDLTLLAAIIQIEAGNECYEGQVAVGSVVMNRLRSGAYSGSISGVIFARGQFSTGRMSSVISKGPKASCVQAATDALNGVDTTGGATHFRRVGSKAGLIIGNHVFY